MKHDILAIHFPATRSDFVFVTGADQNVRCSVVNSRVRKAALELSGKVGQHSRRSAFWAERTSMLYRPTFISFNNEVLTCFV